MSVTYFMSGVCYIKGTTQVARHFSGFITTTDCDPTTAHKEMERIQGDRAKQSGKDVYVHIQQFNEVITK